MGLLAIGVIVWLTVHSVSTASKQKIAHKHDLIEAMQELESQLTESPPLTYPTTLSLNKKYSAELHQKTTPGQFLKDKEYAFLTVTLKHGTHSTLEYSSSLPTPTFTSHEAQ